MKYKLHEFFFRSRRFNIYFERSIQLLILISVIYFSVHTLPYLSINLTKILNKIEFFSILIFSIEFVLSRINGPKPFKFIFSFFELIDLIAILPFYIFLGMNLKSLRVVRLFHLLRLLKFLRYQYTLAKLKQSFDNVKRELFLFSFATLLLIYFSFVGIYFFENEAQPVTFSSIFNAMWWSVVSLTTLGYGDIYHITAEGEIFSIFIVFLCLGLDAIPTGIVASSLTKALMKSKD